jgi:hypothetical protein
MDRREWIPLVIFLLLLAVYLAWTWLSSNNEGRFEIAAGVVIIFSA